jgi:hypothetical protein
MQSRKTKQPGLVFVFIFICWIVKDFNIQLTESSSVRSQGGRHEPALLKQALFIKWVLPSLLYFIKEVSKLWPGKYPQTKPGPLLFFF